MENKDPNNVVPAESTVPALVSREVREAVKEILQESKSVVRTNIVNAYVKEEVDRRTAAVAAVLKKLEEAEREKQKIRPTHLGKSLDGKPVGEPAYTDEQVKSNKELTEKIDKFENALKKALNDGDFTKVFEVVGK